MMMEDAAQHPPSLSVNHVSTCECNQWRGVNKKRIDFGIFVYYNLN